MTNKIDLHGIRHHEVQNLLDKFLTKHLYQGTKEIYIITGNSDKMKDVVDSVLSDYNLSSEYSFLSKAELIVKL